MSYSSIILKDHPIGFWPLDESSGTVAYDYSGCVNNGQYINFSNFDNIMPLVSGGSKSTFISDTQYIELYLNNNYIGDEAKGSFADKYSSDNDFTLELWAYLNNPNSIETPLLHNEFGTGIYVKSNIIYFYVNNSYIAYNPESFNESIHIVATYRKNNLNLIINGKLVASNKLDNFIFSNDPTNTWYLKSNANSSFIIDAPAIYRYALSEEQAASHFNYSQPIRPIQIVNPDGGVLFSGSDIESPKSFIFSYPLTRSFNQLQMSNIFFDPNSNYITTLDSSLDGIATDIIAIPNAVSFISSKIEWEGDNNISVSVTPDIDSIPFSYCQNGKSMPNWNLGNETFSSSPLIYLKININATNENMAKPLLKHLTITFYTEKTIYSDNSGDYINAEVPQSTEIDTSIWDYSSGSRSYSVLRRNKKSGIRPNSFAGFAINTVSNISAIECIFSTPPTMIDGCIFSHPDAWFAWSASGNINKQGISKIYVNGLEYTQATHIYEMIRSNDICHIVFILNGPISNKIYINSKVENGDWKNSGEGYGYSNIAIYPTQLSSSDVVKHYNLYTESSYSYSDPVSMNITEIGVFAYNNDWQVIKSV